MKYVDALDVSKTFATDFGETMKWENAHTRDMGGLVRIVRLNERGKNQMPVEHTEHFHIGLPDFEIGIVER